MKYSKLAYLGDLSRYSMDELKEHLKDWKFYSAVHEEGILAEWSSLFTEIKILYTQEGRMIQIMEERWKCFFLPDKIFLRKV